MILKLPPLQKIYEAYGALADKRVTMCENSAEVVSSGGDRIYTVTWNKNIYSSNDNGTFWQGYAGYPVLAVLMKQKLLPFDGDMAAHFAGIPWKRLNVKYKNDYNAALDEVFSKLQSRGVNIAPIKDMAQRAYDKLFELDIAVKRGARPSKK